MTDGEARRIDALTLAVGELQGAFKAMASQWATQENHATAGRQIIHQKMDALTREVGNISAEMRVATQEIAELKNEVETKIAPQIENYKIGVARKDGFMSASKLLWTAIVAAAGSIGYAAHFFYYGHGAIWR